MSVPPTAAAVLFAGAVQCQATPAPAGAVLHGCARGSGEALQVFLQGEAARSLPPCLTDLRIEQPRPGEARLHSRELDTTLPVAALHVHRDVGAALAAAVPPRAAPWSKRLFWRMVLGLARSSAGLALLTALRGRGAR
ncbi:MAG: hypothetical protein JSR67_08495 [Proteobacteria bacterium]|nr:hypothetical protein [Pseudomonadota bacterium]